MDDKVREAFEKDAEPYGYELEKAKCDCCAYAKDETEYRWLGYQAATQAAEARYKPVVERLVAEIEEAVWRHEDGEQGYRLHALNAYRMKEALAAPYRKGGV